MSFLNLSWQWLVFVGSILTSIGLTFNKYQSHRAASLQVLLYKYFSSVILITIFWLRVNNHLPQWWWLFFLYGMLTGLVVTIYTKASRISLSKTTLVSPSANILGIFLATIWLKEWQLFNLATNTGRQLLFALLLVPVILFLFFEKDKKQDRHWSWLVLFYLGFLGLNRVISKVFLNTTEPIQLLFLQYWGSFAVVSLGIFWKKHNVFIGKRFALRGLIQGLFGTGGTFFYYSALKQVSVTQISLLRTPLFLILNVAVGFILFKELKQMTTKKWFGVTVAMVMMLLVLSANQ